MSNIQAFGNFSIKLIPREHTEVYNTIFAVEFLRHAHRAPLFTNSKQKYDVNGTTLGELSYQGRADSFILGRKRRAEYLFGKELLPHFYDP